MTIQWCHKIPIISQCCHPQAFKNTELGLKKSWVIENLRFFFKIYMLGSLILPHFLNFAYTSHCLLSCQWLVSRFTFLMNVINGNYLISYSGNVLIAENCKYHKSYGGQWLIMDSIYWMVVWLTENGFSRLSILVFFPNLEGTKSGGETKLSLFLLCLLGCARKGEERGSGILSPHFTPSLSLS